LITILRQIFLFTIADCGTRRRKLENSSIFFDLN
jgi:hypothetical protein